MVKIQYQVHLIIPLEEREVWSFHKHRKSMQFALYKASKAWKCTTYVIWQTVWVIISFCAVNSFLDTVKVAKTPLKLPIYTDWSHSKSTYTNIVNNVSNVIARTWKYTILNKCEVFITQTAKRLLLIVTFFQNSAERPCSPKGSKVTHMGTQTTLFIAKFPIWYRTCTTLYVLPLH